MSQQTQVDLASVSREISKLWDERDEARALVSRLGAENARLRAALNDIAAGADTAAGDFCRVGAVGLARILRGFADQARKAFNEEDQHG